MPAPNRKGRCGSGHERARTPRGRIDIPGRASPDLATGSRGRRVFGGHAGGGLGAALLPLRRAGIGYRFFDMTDIAGTYYPYAIDMSRASAPFRDFFIEYPPLFVPLLWAGGNPASQSRRSSSGSLLLMIAVHDRARASRPRIASIDGASTRWRPYVGGRHLLGSSRSRSARSPRIATTPSSRSCWRSRCCS